MLGTLNGGLEARGIKLTGDAISADVMGENEIVDGMPVLTHIEVSYSLRIPHGTREVVERLLSKHQSKCPTAVSLQGKVQVSWKADIEEGP
jgi:organic hydroperoxide reductase OsmC/OhrA